MTAVLNVASVKPVQLVGVQEIDLTASFTHYKVTVRGTTGLVTVAFMPVSMDGYDPFDDEASALIEENSSAVFLVGPSQKLRLTPANLGNAYTVAVVSW
jgi:hypothetical protein